MLPGQNADVNATLEAAFAGALGKEQSTTAVYMLPMLASYSCGGFDHADRRDGAYNPDLQLYREAASSAGVDDFRVIFLYRELEECLASDCLHRNIGAES